MAVTWTITNMEYTNDSDKGVVHAAWSASETDGDHTGTVSGMESYTPDSSAEGYVAWDSLDESTVVGWVKETLGADECTRVEGKVADQITKSKTPPTSWGVAWS
jgi:hypothetical protein